MLIDFNYIVEKYIVDIKGIIHVGGHLAEEYDFYKNKGIKNVIWIEANPFIFNQLKEKAVNNLCYNSLISDRDNNFVDFYLTNNGQSSSMLEMDRHKQHHPSVYVYKKIQLKSIRLDTLIKTEKINISNYNFLNLDIQGAELLALKGMSNNLNHVDYIYTEVNVADVYKGCSKLDDLDIFLLDYGFKRVELKMTPYEWGDAFYIKENQWIK